MASVKHQFERELTDFTPNESCFQALEELLAFLHREQIQAIVVMAPQAETLRRLYHKERLEQLVSRVVRMSERYRSRFVNAFEWLSEDQFADCIHPTSSGADLFSRRLAQEALLPTLRGEFVRVCLWK